MKLRFLLMTMLALACLTAGAQSMKMVVNNRGQVVGRYVKTNKTTYTVLVQDDCTVPIKGHRVVTFSAKNGQGDVYRKFEVDGNINVRKGPSKDTPVIGKIVDNKIDGCVPDCYECLGLTKGWYKIRFSRTKVGYVRADLMEWDGMCTF